MKKLPAETTPKRYRPTLRLEEICAIAAVEGLTLSPDGLRRITSPKTPEQRRAEIIRVYQNMVTHP